MLSVFFRGGDLRRIVLGNATFTDPRVKEETREGQTGGWTLIHLPVSRLCPLF